MNMIKNISTIQTNVRTTPPHPFEIMISKLTLIHTLIDGHNLYL